MFVICGLLWVSFRAVVLLLLRSGLVVLVVVCVWRFGGIVLGDCGLWVLRFALVMVGPGLLLVGG